MTKAVIVHNVVDIERWLQGKEERAAIIGRFATDIQDYLAEDGSNQIALTFDVHDMEGLRSIASSPSEGDAAGMKQRGVIPPLKVFVAR